MGNENNKINDGLIFEQEIQRMKYNGNKQKFREKVNEATGELTNAISNLKKKQFMNKVEIQYLQGGESHQKNKRKFHTENIEQYNNYYKPKIANHHYKNNERKSNKYSFIKRQRAKQNQKLNINYINRDKLLQQRNNYN